jgi:hypothetical protein
MCQSLAMTDFDGDRSVLDASFVRCLLVLPRLTNRLAGGALVPCVRQLRMHKAIGRIGPSCRACECHQKPVYV